MYIVALAWAYVVLLMAAAEALSPDGTLLAALLIVVFYGALPLSLVLFFMGRATRRRRPDDP
jgi:membrane protein implicated in regulation of membrane protease activity